MRRVMVRDSSTSDIVKQSVGETARYYRYVVGLLRYRCDLGCWDGDRVVSYDSYGLPWLRLYDDDEDWS